MKKIIAFVFLISLNSCKEYKALMAETSKYNSQKKLYFNDVTKEAFTVKINGLNHNLFFDTGAGVTLINNPKFSLDEKRIIRQKTIYGFDKKAASKSATYSVDSLSTSLFSVKDKYLYISKIENKKDCSVEKYDGILGNFFSEIENPIELNYENGFVEIIKEDFDKTNYIPLEAKFNSISGKFAISITVNGLSDFFIFDTGNKLSILLNKDVFINMNNKITTIGSSAYGVNNTLILNKFDVFDCVFKLSEGLSFNQFASIDNTSKRSILNQQFIKKFNWIIDAKNKKVYCKPINSSNLNLNYKIQKIHQLSSCSNSKIYVSYCIIGVSKFNLGDEITAMDDQKVTPSNICEMQDLLNKTQDWSVLKLAIIPVTK